MSTYHKTVLLIPTVDAIAPKPGGIYVDCTAGGGDHSAEILRRIGDTGRLIASPGRDRLFDRPFCRRSPRDDYSR